MMESPAFVIEALPPEEEAKYEAFVQKYPETLIYASTAYRYLLADYLDAEDQSLVAVSAKGEFLAVLPALLKRSPDHGTVLNSLPFYSHGAVVGPDALPIVKQALLAAFFDLARRADCVSATLITSPFEKDRDLYSAHAPRECVSEHTGQVTTLKEFKGTNDEEVLKKLTAPQAETIRKALESGVTCRVSNTEADMELLFRMHRESAGTTGEIAKERLFFQKVMQHLDKKHYSIHVAEANGEPIAALLLLKYNRTVEYLVTGTVATGRLLQLLPLLVFKAMRHTANEGYSWWNWGETRTALQRPDELERWNTQDRGFHYYTKIIDKTLLTWTREEVISRFPNFFVLPFDRLKV